MKVNIKKEFRIPGSPIKLEVGDKLEIQEANPTVSALESFIKKTYRGSDLQIGKNLAIDIAHALSNVSQEAFDAFIDELERSYL